MKAESGRSPLTLALSPDGGEGSAVMDPEYGPFILGVRRHVAALKARTCPRSPNSICACASRESLQPDQTAGSTRVWTALPRATGPTLQGTRPFAIFAFFA